MVDIALLKTFLELNRTRHFGNTAKRLFLTQSAVSARMRQLEEILGVSLFTRDRNNIHLTPAGLRFLSHAENIVNAWNRAKQEMALEDESKQFVTIGGVHSLWDTHLQDWFYTLHNDHEELAFQVEAGSQDDLVRQLVEGTLDLAFIYDAPKIAELLNQPVGQIELIMVSSHEGLSAQEAVDRKDYIMVDWGISFAISHAQQFPNMPAPEQRIGLGRFALNFLHRCGGSAYLPKSMVMSELTQQSLYQVTGADSIYRDFYCVFAQRFKQREAAEGILNHLSRYYQSTANS